MDSTFTFEPVYDPEQLLDTLISKWGLKSDAALSRVLNITPQAISKIRHRKSPVGAALLIRMHEESGLSIKELRTLMGDRRKRFRISTIDCLPYSKKISTFAPPSQQFYSHEIGLPQFVAPQLNPYESRT